MLDRPCPLLSVTETNRYQSEMRAIVPDARRADEFIDGTLWILCRNPEYGQTVTGGSSVRMVSVNEGAVDIPPLVLYYTFNATHVIFLSITLSPDP